jgi:O-antigen ligase
METTEKSVALTRLLGLFALPLFSVLAMAKGYAVYAVWLPLLVSVPLFVWSGFSVWFWMALGFSAAFSQDLSLPGGMVVNFPAEPLAACLLLRLCMEFLSGKISKKLLFHPTGMLLALWLLWNLISALSSTMPLVSFKQLLVKSTYVLTFYFLLLHEWQLKQLKSKDLFLSFAAGFFPVVLFIWWKHSQFGFSKDASGFASRPFFHDHTQYSAIICLLLPFFSLRKFREVLCIIFLLTALYFSFSRAAYVSLILSAGIYLFYYAGFSHRIMFFLLLLVGLFAAWNSGELISSFRENKNDSNARYAGLAEQAKSITNITTDQSNAERLNRWSCALRMAKEKPFTGYGPGTYQFSYLSFQRRNEITRISVTNPNVHEDGRGGTAHNEYLLALSESGIPAALLYFLLCVTAIKTAFSNRKLYAAGLAVCTYFLHGFFNNFLDTPAVSLLFFAWLAYIANEQLQQEAHPAPAL